MAMQEFMIMQTAAVGLATLGIISVVVIAVLSSVKTAGTGVDNATIDLFIAGITVFGTFATVIALTLVGKIVVGLVKGGM